jgi:hypothetical protein
LHIDCCRSCVQVSSAEYVFNVGCSSLINLCSWALFSSLLLTKNVSNSTYRNVLTPLSLIVL